MPLTDEIKALLGDKATEEQVVSMILGEAKEALTKTGHIIRTTEQDDSFVKAKVEEQIKEGISNVHKKYDEDVFEILAKRKKPTQKTYEFIKEEMKSLKAKADASGESVDKDKLVELQNALEKANSDKTDEIAKVQEKYFKKSVDSMLSSELDLASFAIPAHIKTDAEKQTYVANQKRMIKTDFLSTYTAKEDEAGNTVFYQGDKMISNTTDAKPLSAGDIIRNNYGSHFSQEKRSIGGGGTGNASDDPSSFTKRTQVYDHLEAKGFEKGTNKFRNEAAKIIKEHGITEE